MCSLPITMLSIQSFQSKPKSLEHCEFNFMVVNRIALSTTKLMVHLGNLPLPSAERRVEKKAI
mgnify:CR=1 FL=1